MAVAPTAAQNAPAKRKLTSGPLEPNKPAVSVKRTKSADASKTNAFGSFSESLKRIFARKPEPVKRKASKL